MASEAEASPSTQEAPVVVSLGQSSGGRTSGKFWKDPKKATVRSHLPAGVKTKSWETRMAQKSKEEAIKKLQNQLKEEKAAEAEKRTNMIKERRARVEEKKRLEEAAARMSAKKLQRMKKRLGRTKKVNG